MNGFNLDLKKKWYVVANRTEAVIYREGSEHTFEFVNRISNPAGAEQEQNLDSDKPGRGFSSAQGSIHHSLDRHSHRHEDVAKKFALKIGKLLEDAKRDGEFTELVFAAEPHFLGLLRKAMPPALQAIVTHEIPKEFKRGSDTEIHQHILNAIESKK